MPTWKSKYASVKFIRSNANLGFAGGNNLGIKEAKGEYLFFVNNDTEFTDHLVEELVSTLDKNPARTPPPAPRFAAISGVVLNDATADPHPARRGDAIDDGRDAARCAHLQRIERRIRLHRHSGGQIQIACRDARLRETGWFGATKSNRAPSTLKLAPGDVRYGITFRLRPLGSISAWCSIRTATQCLTRKCACFNPPGCG